MRIPMRRSIRSIPFAMTILMALAVWAIPGAARAGFHGALVECSQVTTPAALTPCGSDPLTSGVASINDEGDVQVSVSGAGASQTYAVEFRAPDGSNPVAIGNLNTGGQGNGQFHKNAFFALHKFGAGNIVL